MEMMLGILIAIIYLIIIGIVFAILEYLKNKGFPVNPDWSVLWPLLILFAIVYTIGHVSYLITKWIIKKY